MNKVEKIQAGETFKILSESQSYQFKIEKGTDELTKDTFFIYATYVHSKSGLSTYRENAGIVNFRAKNFEVKQYTGITFKKTIQLTDIRLV